MTRRLYVDRSHAYAPFDNAVLQGLGAVQKDKNGWPVGRSYVGIAHFRAPYDEFGYFQDNTLQGLGNSHMNSPTQNSYVSVKGLGTVAGSELDAISQNASGGVKRFLLAGDPVSSLRSDVTLPFNQVHPYVYGGIALAALATSYYSYKRWKKTRGAGT
jgi:hypothetical protein